MLLNYLKIGWRSLRREGGFALLNALGLAIGIAAVVLVGLYVANELAIAWHHPDGDRVFRVIRRTEVSGAEASHYLRQSRRLECP